MAADLLYQTNAFTVITQDNCSIHTCKAVKVKIKEWEAKGLVLFQLPPYCSEMNPIELEWQHLKRDELSGRMFNSEDELALAVKMALYSRYDCNGFGTSYF
jgi:putative transposase